MDNSTNKLQENLIKIKDYVAKLSKRTKIIAGAVAGGIVLLAIILVIVLNAGSGEYTALYSGLSTSETGSIYQALLGMGADAHINSSGDVEVPTSEYDIWLLQLAAEGYPKTALPYDLFSDHAGMTSTESEKSEWLIYQLQDRIQATLERMDGVENAVVTITDVESNGYVWEAATNTETASAGVLLTIKDGVTISADQVTAIKNLIAASVPKMKPEDVTVVDASTMLDLATSTAPDDTTRDGQNLAFEMLVQNQIEANVVRLLSPRYGNDGVVAVAKVTIDYDEMMTEKYELQAKNEDGDGFLTHNDGDYTVNGEEPAGDIVGEENNTDIPEYGYNAPDEEGGMTDYHWNNDYDYGYIKTQIESGNAILKRATVSVMVNEESLTPNRREELTNLVSGATDIPTDLIFVSAISYDAAEDAPNEEPGDLPSNPFADLPLWMYIAAGVALLILIVVICVVIVTVKKRNKRKAEKRAEEEERRRADAEKRQQAEINDYKRSLEDMAKANLDPKNEAIIEEVKNFARSNPQVTANLLRTWMKEGE